MTVLSSKSSEDVEGMHIKSADDKNLEGELGQGGPLRFKVILTSWNERLKADEM